MKKHVVKNLRLNEISSVDRPAQVGATSVLIKRGAPREMDLLKVTFDQALKGNLLADRVRDAFYEAFDDLWGGKEAFRKALIDELASGGDGNTASDAFKTWLGSLVDQALGAAKALDAGDIAGLEKTIKKAASDWLESQETIMKTKAELKAAITKALAAGAALTVGEVQAIHKAATDLEADDLLPVEGPLAKACAPGDKVDDKTKKKVDQMVKRDALPADLRKHYDTLDTDEARDEFLSKSATEQADIIQKSKGDDPVLYTTLDGIDIRKSAGDTALALAKSADNSQRELVKLRATTEDTVLEKRAGDELGHVGGDLLGKKALLKAVDGITDTATRDAAVAVLKAANAAAKGAFVRKGSAAEDLPEGEGAADRSEAEEQLEKLAQAYAKDKSVTFEKAYTEVLQTAEGSALYKRFAAGA